MLVSLLWIAAALAAEPVVQKADGGFIVGWVDLPTPPAEVFAVVSDPEAVARIDGSTKVQATRDGDCLAVSTHVEHPIASADYQTRSCPDGELAVKQTLAGGAAMKEYEARFQVEARDGGSRLNYRIHVVSTLPVPQFVVDRATVQGTTRLLARLRDHFAAAPAPGQAPGDGRSVD